MLTIEAGTLKIQAKGILPLGVEGLGFGDLYKRLIQTLQLKVWGLGLRVSGLGLMM